MRTPAPDLTNGRRRQAAVLLAALLLGLPAALAQVPAAVATAPATTLPNQRDPLPGVRTGGMPESPEGYGALGRAGFRTFVDLRTDREVAAAERAAVEAAGMTYVRIPVAGEADLDLASARALDALLDDAARRPLVIACASGNRVGALLAVSAFWLDGQAAEPALELGRRAGLTRLEPAVRQLLGLAGPAAPAPAPAR
jgi:protein tyrosine phosphatase (PTP) superfamily phosphohydrolase (DUF442 family)